MNQLQKSAMFFILVAYLPFYIQSSLVFNLYLLFCFLFVPVVNKVKAQKVLLISLMGIGISLVYLDFYSLWGLEPGCSLLSLFAIVKIYEVKDVRDFSLFMFIAFLSVCAHVLTVENLYMLGYVSCICFSMYGLLMYFYRGDNQTDEIIKERRSIFLKIFTSAIGLGVILFFIFPRVSIGNIFNNTVSKKNYTGFTNRLNPGDISEVINDDTVYFKVKFKKDEPPFEELYWRGAVLNKNSGMRWDRERQIKPALEKYKNKKFQYTVDFEALTNSAIFLLKNSIGLDRHSRGHIQYRGDDTYKFYPFGNEKISYSAIVAKKKIVLKMNSKLRSFYTRYDESIKETRFFQFVSEKNFKSSREAIDFLKNYINEKPFFYTLKPGTLKSDRPIDEFFFKKRQGLCEHYASTLALFLRVAKIPARVVVGLHGGLYNPVGEFYTLRAADAHAWVEVWDEVGGWQTVDPTGWIAPNRIRYGAESYFTQSQDLNDEKVGEYIQEAQSSFFGQLSFRLDSFYYNLNRLFINYDIEAQRDLMKSLGLKSRYFVLILVAVLILFITLVLGGLYFIFRPKVYDSEVDRIFAKFIKKAKKNAPITESMGPLKMEDVIAKENVFDRSKINRVFFIYKKLKYTNVSDKDYKKLIKLFKKRLRDLKV